jgi:uncharacterized membrane protein
MFGLSRLFDELTSTNSKSTNCKSKVVMLLNNFRAKLYQEMQLWRDEGIINNLTYEKLTKRYQLENLEASKAEKFVFAVIALGGFLVGLGIMTFAAGSWEGLAKEVKVALLLTILFTTNIIGFCLWQKSIKATLSGEKIQRRKEIIGQSLLVLGGFLLGINLSLVAEIFQFNYANYELFLAWGFGVAIMAYGLRLTALAILALIILQIGYFMGLDELQFVVNDMNWSQIVVEHMPLLLWVVFVPLAILCKSRWVFTLGAIAFTFALQFNISPLKYLNDKSIYPWFASFAFAIPPALLWSYDDLLFPKVDYRWFQPLARSLAILFFCILFYVLTFSWHWQSAFSTQILAAPTVSKLNLAVLTDVISLSIIAIVQWVYLVQRGFNWMNPIILTGIAIAIFTPFWYSVKINNLEIIPILLFNILLAIIAISLISQGIEYKERLEFWAGMIMLNLQIISRFFEYNTDLFLKSFTVTACGVLIILAGLQFEKYLVLRRQ